MRRKQKIAVGEIYHIYNRSIAEFKIFNKKSDFERLKKMLLYYQAMNMVLNFSKYINLVKIKKKDFYSNFVSDAENKEKIVQLIAYCIMPTHIHFILKELKINGISIFMGNILNSYAKYFNISHRRKGPLWEGRFQNVLVKTDEQLLHLTRYIHLNPVTARLIDKPELWIGSSYAEYISAEEGSEKQDICDFRTLLDIKATSYKKFVEDRISYQRELSKLKKLVIE